MVLILPIVWWGLGVVLSVVAAVLIVLFVYVRWNYGQLEKLGIPVVKPHLFLGSNPNGHNEKAHIVDLERSKTYGPVYGVYDGRAPTVYVSDPHILRIILSRDFDHFRNHRPFLEAEHPIVAEVPDFLNDEKWKTIRAVLTPHFTLGKIKQMAETISEVSEEYVTALMEENKENCFIKMDFKKYIPPLIFEVIGKCFCGINIENARNPDNQLISMLKEAMGGEFEAFDWTFTLYNTLPILAKYVPMLPREAIKSFDLIMRRILKEREDSKLVKDDMVNTILETFCRSRTDPNYKRLGITENTAIAQGFGSFFASYEGTRSTLSLLTYFLATCPEIQDKLLAEIDSALEKSNGRVTFDSVSDLPYLTACISETFRITPGIFRPDRRCTKDWEYNGMRIKKGMNVIIPLWALHRDPTQYRNPETFEPERFLAGRKEQIDTYAFSNFGHGPRACIGQRFAYEMIKITLTQFLKKFRIERRADTVFRDHTGNPFFLTYDPILVNFVRRK